MKKLILKDFLTIRINKKSNNQSIRQMKLTKIQIHKTKQNYQLIKKF